MLPGLLAVLVSAHPWTAPVHDGPAPIFGGELVEPGAWPSAVAIEIGLDKRCTGTLVSDRVVLTAAHCLFEQPASLRVVIGDDVYAGAAQTLAVASYGFHPDYCDDLDVCLNDNWDYGYVVLEQPVSGVASTRPLTRQDEWDEVMRVGTPVTVVGFGVDESTWSGFKREVEVPITSFTDSGLEFRAGGMGLDSCDGDSGGPVFVTLASGEVVLAGVTSRGTPECGGGGVYAIPYAALCWLNQETGLDLRTDACDACDCLDTAPEADTRCGCAAGDPAGPLGLALLALWRRRRRHSSAARPAA